MNEEIRNNEINEEEMENVSGGNILVEIDSPRAVEENAGDPKNAVFCPRRGSKMKPTVPMRGIVTSGPGYVCTDCGHVR